MRRTPLYPLLYLFILLLPPLPLKLQLHGTQVAVILILSSTQTWQKLDTDTLPEKYPFKQSIPKWPITVITYLPHFPPRISCLHFCSLCGRRSKGKGKGEGIRARDHVRGRRGTPARKPLFLPSPLLKKKVTKITQLWMTSCQIRLAAMHVFYSYFSHCFSFVFLKQSKVKVL